MTRLPLNIQYFSNGTINVSYKEKRTDGSKKVNKVEVVLTAQSSTGTNGTFQNNSSLIADGWALRNNNTELFKRYNQNITENISVNVYFSSTSASTETVTIDVTQIGDDIEETFGFCHSKCGHPVYTKNDFAVVTTTITTETENQLINDLAIDYPDGFNKDNTFLLTSKIKGDGSYPLTQYITKYTGSQIFYDETIGCNYQDSKIYLSGRLPYFEIGTKVTINLILMKIDETLI